MQGRKIAIIGNASDDFLDFVNDNSIDYTIFIDIRRESASPNCVLSDFTTPDTLYRAVIDTKTTFTSIITFYEEYIIDTAIIAHKLKLPGLSPESAIACTDKTVMRSAFFAADPTISPAYKLIKSEQEALDFANKYSYPLIIKPANLAKSLLVKKVNSINELKSAYVKTMAVIDDVYAQHAPRNDRKLLIEEFVVGSIHSIDAFVDGKGEPHLLQDIVDYETGYDIGYNDNFHFSRTIPTKLTAVQQKQLKECAKKGVRSLKMTHSPAHIEIIMSKSGPKIVEIGARNGGYRQKMHNVANGINLYENHINLLYNMQLNLKSTKNEPCIVVELFPKTLGRFVGIKNEDTLQKMQSLGYINIRVKKGNVTGLSSHGYKAVAVVMLSHPNKTIVEQDLEFIKQNVEVLTNNQT